MAKDALGHGSNALLQANKGGSDASFAIAKIQLQIANAQDDLAHASNDKEKLSIQRNLDSLGLSLSQAGVGSDFAVAHQQGIAAAVPRGNEAWRDRQTGIRNRTLGVNNG